MRIERWIFTAKEIAHPENCKGNDIFISPPPGEYELEMGVQIQRNGVVTNRWGDGTVGVPQWIQDLASAEETLSLPDGTETADVWQDVVTKDGKFVSWGLTKARKQVL